VSTPRTYRLVHTTRYEYDDEVTASYGRGHLVPRSLPGQYRRSARITVDPHPGDLREHIDFFGNHSTYFAVKTPHTSLSVTSQSVVEVSRRVPSYAQLDGLGWEEARDRLRDRRDLTPGLVDARPFVLTSPMIGRWPEVEAYARPSFPPGATLGEATQQLVSRVHQDHSYVAGATTVGTTLPEVLRQRKGVCQDFAHLVVGCLRSVGVAARYVSGYIETTRPPGPQRLLGADASHAWVSVFAPGVGWMDVDPTNHRLVDDRYVIVALGRDYRDVSPLRGVIFTEGNTSRMRVMVDMLPIGREGTSEEG
jgi:transglutaminase-like putative cysteine protease